MVSEVTLYHTFEFRDLHVVSPTPFSSTIAVFSLTPQARAFRSFDLWPGETIPLSLRLSFLLDFRLRDWPPPSPFFSTDGNLRRARCMVPFVKRLAHSCRADSVVNFSLSEIVFLNSVFPLLTMWAMRSEVALLSHFHPLVRPKLFAMILIPCSVFRRPFPGAILATPVLPLAAKLRHWAVGRAWSIGLVRTNYRFTHVGILPPSREPHSSVLSSPHCSPDRFSANSISFFCCKTPPHAHLLSKRCCHAVRLCCGKLLPSQVKSPFDFTTRSVGNGRLQVLVALFMPRVESKKILDVPFSF